MNDLPLNGRNFTELLTILPGTANINTDQNSERRRRVEWRVVGKFMFPAVNGARNRSNYFILDGANDLTRLLGTYNYAPIVDAIQEFKSQGHNDLAEYGGAAGASERGDKVRNQPVPRRPLGVPAQRAMDSRGYFESARRPCGRTSMALRRAARSRFQSSITAKTAPSSSPPGKATATPRNANKGGALGPTDAMRNGDFSALGVDIYDPATTALQSGNR